MQKQNETEKKNKEIADAIDGIGVIKEKIRFVITRTEEEMVREIRDNC